MKTYRVPVEMTVVVTIDETKFDEAFMSEFRDHFYSFTTLGEHLQHLAQLQARGILSSKFIEGYGPPGAMGIVADVDERGCHFEVGNPEEIPTSSLHVSMVNLLRDIEAHK